MSNCIGNIYNEITIEGKTLDEIIIILRGLDIERQLDIKMTMENISYLWKKICQQEQNRLRNQMKDMFR